jgi:hypothetical protein
MLCAPETVLARSTVTDAGMSPYSLFETTTLVPSDGKPSVEPLTANLR